MTVTRLVVGGAIVGLLLAHAGESAAGVLVLGGLVVAVWALAGRTSGRPAAGRAMVGYGHGTQRLISRHEAGHAAAARALGGRVRRVEVWKDGGLTSVTLPRDDPQDAITFWRAGRHAAGTGAGCSDDDRLIRRELRRVPSADRSRVRRDADRDARRIVRRSAGPIRKEANRLLGES